MSKQFPGVDIDAVHGGQMAKPPVFDEKKLGEEIARVWGEHGAHMEVYRMLLAERGRYVLPGQWQPIETAPKDGTWILMWRGAPINRMDQAQWKLDVFGKEYVWGGPGWEYPPENLPTHWLPLPEGPRSISLPPSKGD